jgi:hypothetical protein
MKPLKSACLPPGSEVAPFRRDQQLLKRNTFAVQTKRLERKNENSDKHRMTSENVAKAEQKSHAER